MLKMKTKPTTLPPTIADGGVGDSGGHHWEMRPGGMLVQKRSPDSQRVGAHPPMIRVRIKFGSVYHEIKISPQATFGELKKMLSGPTGLHYQDQKIFYKDKERDSKAFLDIVGVKDKSKMVLIEDHISQEKRLMEMRKNAKTEKASKAISDIGLEVDRLAGRVSGLEMVINKGGRVAEKDLVNLIELLMNELLKLDSIVAGGDVKLQRKMQVRRVQKYVETLDVLKIKNSMPKGEIDETQMRTQKQSQSLGQRLASIQELSNVKPRQETVVEEAIGSLIDMPIHANNMHEIQEQEAYHHGHHPRNSGSVPVLVSTKWETFDATPEISTKLSNTTINHAVPLRFNWEFFD